MRETFTGKILDWYFLREYIALTFISFESPTDFGKRSSQNDKSITLPTHVGVG